MNILKLRLYMIGTLALIFGISTLAFTIILDFLGDLSFFSLVFTVVGFNVLQWLIAPYLVDMMYRVKPANPGEFSDLHQMVQGLSAKTGVSTPRLMIPELPIPNAFAYGSPLTGSRVAVTRGLLNQLPPEEVEAVLGHEFGHLRHRDVQIMLFVSLLPSVFYLIAQYTMYSSYYSMGSSNNRRNGNGLALIGGISMVIYFVLLLFSLGLSRLREYYADQHSAMVVDQGATKLSGALARVHRNRQDDEADEGPRVQWVQDPVHIGS